MHLLVTPPGLEGEAESALERLVVINSGSRVSLAAGADEREESQEARVRASVRGLLMEAARGWAQAPSTPELRQRLLNILMVLEKN